MPRLAVIGHPVAHSRSPAMQNAALAALGLGEEWSYEAIDVAPEDFEARVRAMAGEGFAGANVTVPHKEAALALADEPSEAAREIGAANTLSLRRRARSAPTTPTPAGLLAALPALAARARGRWCSAPAAPPGRWSGRWCGEGAEVEVWNRTALRARGDSARSSAGSAGRRPRARAPTG